MGTTTAGQNLKVGQVVTDGQGNYKQWSGSGWNDIPAPVGKAPGSPVRALTPQEATALEARRTQLTAANELNQNNQAAIPASNRLNSGPYRGMLLDAAIPNPDNKGGMLDSLGAWTLGPLARMTGAITPQDVQDYQTVKRAENQAVLAKQLPQKGAQTESDAARMAMTGVSTSNSPRQNLTVQRHDAAAQAYLAAKTAFETAWTNKYGLNGLNEQGQDITTAFQHQYNAPSPNAKGPVIRRIN
jgi:hypothetical protein